MSDGKHGPEGHHTRATEAAANEPRSAARRRPWWHWAILLGFLLLIAIIQFIPG